MGRNQKKGEVEGRGTRSESRGTSARTGGVEVVLQTKTKLDSISL